MSPGELIRTARTRRGLSQASLARRTGTKQSAISRLENDELSPTVQTLQLLLRAMGEELAFESAPVKLDGDDLHDADWRRRSAQERFELALSWNRLAGRLQTAGNAARIKGRKGG